MNIKITGLSKIYRIETTYYSEQKGRYYPAEIRAGVDRAGRIYFRTKNMRKEFVFENSDPDRIIAVAGAMLDFAKRIKEEQGCAS